MLTGAKMLSIAAAFLFAVAEAGVCDDCTTLLEVVDEVKVLLPGSGTEEYYAPSVQVMADWQQVVLEMLDGNCSADLPPSLSSVYGRELFNDANMKDYCILASSDVAAPWGTVFVYNGGDAKNLSLHAPHPLVDSDTGEQTVAVFRGTNAALFEMSGSHRYANTTASSCQAGYKVADPAHNVNCFQATASAIKEHYNGVNHTAIQFHGMLDDSCVGVHAYITHGSTIPPQADEKIDLLRDAIAAELAAFNPTITVPGDAPGCTLSGTDNVQGRLLNNVDPADVCSVYSSGYTGRFIHIEQEDWVRHQHAHWISAINSVDFDAAVPARSITLLSPLSGSFGLRTTFTVEWTSSGIPGDVKLSFHKGGKDGSVSTIATEAPNTGSYEHYLNNPLATSESYLLRVRSVDYPNIAVFSAPLTFYHLITVVSPNGGEQLDISDPLDVHWSAPELVGSVEVTLMLNGNYHKRIVSETENDGYYQWAAIPTDDVAPGSYTVRVRSKADTGIRDVSDSTFDLVA
ncbi:hypothetical protein DIPPA_27089 [Diplonema papillatum]|nr:hypothetical protein DIPPA_27089 [Diplonema papillatum]